jgi:hypothetical protein
MHAKRVGPARRPTAKAAAWSVVGALLAAAILAPASFGAAPTPVMGSADVDGNAGEWTSADYFADMTDGGDAGRDTHATLSVRYDCDTETLYALVLTDVPGKAKQDRPDEAYMAIDGTKVVRASHGDDGSPPISPGSTATADGPTVTRRPPRSRPAPTRSAPTCSTSSTTGMATCHSTQSHARRRS